MKLGISSPRARRVQGSTDRKAQDTQSLLPKKKNGVLPVSVTESQKATYAAQRTPRGVSATRAAAPPPSSSVPTNQPQARRRSSFAVLPEAFEKADNSTVANRKVSIVELLAKAKKEEEDEEDEEVTDEREEHIGRTRASDRKTSIWDIGDIFGGGDDDEGDQKGKKSSKVSTRKSSTKSKGAAKATGSTAGSGVGFLRYKNCSLPYLLYINSFKSPGMALSRSEGPGDAVDAGG